MKYRKKPIEVEAWQFKGPIMAGMVDDRPKWLTDAIMAQVVVSDPAARECLMIKMLSGPARVNIGDWILVDHEEELYPCRDHIFLETYEIIPGPGMRTCSVCQGRRTVVGGATCGTCAGLGLVPTA